MQVIKTNVQKHRSQNFQENTASIRKCSVNKGGRAKLTLIIINLLISFHCFALTIKNKIQDFFSR